MPLAHINGTELFYVEVGEGAPCLMMHGGLGFDHTSLHPWFGPLSDVMRLLYYDRRANGRRHASLLVRRNPPVRLGDAQDGIWENAPVRVRCNENEGAVGDERREQASVRALHRPFELDR